MLTSLKLDPACELDAAILKHRRNFLNVFGLSCAFNTLMLAPSIYMLQVYDRAMTSRNITTLLMLTLILLVVLAVMNAVDAARASILQRVGVQLQESLGQRVYDAVLRRHLRAPTPGGTQSMNDLTTLRQFLGGMGPISFFDIPWTPIFLAVIWMIHPWMGLFCIGSIAISAALALMNERLSTGPLLQANQENYRSVNMAAGQVRNAEVAEALGMIPRLRAKWMTLQNHVLALQSDASQSAAFAGALSRFVRVAAQSLMLGLGAWLAIEGFTTAGGMIAGSILVARVLAPIEQLIAHWRSSVMAMQARGQLKELLAAFPATPPSIALPAPSGAVNIDSLTAMAPNSEKVVIQDLALRISAGDAVAVIGPSASGKSSLARLLVGLWSPSSGHIRLDGADVAQWDKAELGKWLGYLPQDVELFDGTVAENIGRFGEADSEAVIAAAKMAGAHRLALQLPKGYDTPLVNGAAALSPGQRQRIALARALYGDVRLVVLDEPDASLDEAGLNALLRAIQELKRRKVTTIVVSHRLPVIKSMDKLIVLNEGRLSAYGPTEAVLKAVHEAKKAQQAAPATPGGTNVAIAAPVEAAGLEAEMPSDSALPEEKV